MRSKSYLLINTNQQIDKKKVKLSVNMDDNNFSHSQLIKIMKLCQVIG